MIKGERDTLIAENLATIADIWQELGNEMESSRYRQQEEMLRQSQQGTSQPEVRKLIGKMHSLMNRAAMSASMQYGLGNSS